MVLEESSAGHSTDDVVQCPARTFLHAYHCCIGGGAHGLATQRFGGGGGKHPSGKIGNGIEKVGLQCLLDG